MDRQYLGNDIMIRCPQCRRPFWECLERGQLLGWNYCPECEEEEYMGYLRIISRAAVFLRNNIGQQTISEFLAYPPFGKYMMRIGALKVVLLAWPSTICHFSRHYLARSVDARKLYLRDDILDYILMFIVPYEWNRHAMIVEE